MKIVINKCFGGFSLSQTALDWFVLIGGSRKTAWGRGRDIKRDNPFLVDVVEKLGEQSWGGAAQLKVVEIPDNVEWEIEEYDGREWVAEKHRTWS